MHSSKIFKVVCYLLGKKFERALMGCSGALRKLIMKKPEVKNLVALSL
jgi:hypothetical protein